MIRFRYHPLVDDFSVLGAEERFTRAIIVDEVVGPVFDLSIGVRIATETVTGLPAGLYWFSGLNERHAESRPRSDSRRGQLSALANQRTADLPPRP